MNGLVLTEASRLIVETDDGLILVLDVAPRSESSAISSWLDSRAFSSNLPELCARPFFWKNRCASRSADRTTTRRTATRAVVRADRGTWNGRKDNLYEFGGGLAWEFVKSWSLRPEILYIRDQSNSVGFNYSSTEYWLNIRKGF